MSKVSKVQAILSLVPTAQVLVRGTELDAQVEWNDPTVPPVTEQQIADEFYRLVEVGKLEDCKTQAKKLIAATDWSVLSDVNISNRSDFESYRATLRNFILNPIANPDFPVEPQPIWS